ncbi:MAG: phage protein GemA/Gp16 family protein [Phycisphaerae bacterium]
MPNKSQIKLIQIAVKKAGIRATGNASEGRYRLLLGQYKLSNGRPATSCKQLTNSQVEDLLAICESLGFRHPGKPDDFYRKKSLERDDAFASYAQQSAVQKLADDLCWSPEHLRNFIYKVTFVDYQGEDACGTNRLALLSPKQAYKVIEGLKAILSRQTGKQYNSMQEAQSDMEVANDKPKSQIG